MAIFYATPELIFNAPAYVEHTKYASSPSLPIRALRFFANRIPTSTLSDIAHRCINFAGDTWTGSRDLRDGYAYERWKQARINDLLVEANCATSLTQYQASTTELDQLQGHDKWKIEKHSTESEYNPEVIEAHLEQLAFAAKSGDVDSMITQLRTTLSRDLGGMSNLLLYKHSWFGTKQLIDDYIETVVATIERFLEITADLHLSTTEARNYQNTLEDALRYLGRSALTLSGGAILGMKHIGVVKALWEADLLPQIISGASAGSVVAGIVGSCTDEEMAEHLAHFPNIDLSVFDPPGTTILGYCARRLHTLYRSGVFYDISSLERVMKAWCGDITFKEAFHKTRRILNISVSAPAATEARLLNYITAPDVYIWSAICASCSVPGFFQPTTIYEKDPFTRRPVVWLRDSQQTFVDGSLDIDIPIRKLSEMFNVNFSICSQVNPHIRMFLPREQEFSGVQWAIRHEQEWQLLRTSLEFVRKEMVYRAQQMADAGFPRWIYRGASVLSQQYTGDVNVFPKIDFGDYLILLQNPSPGFIQRAVLQGEQSTWPKICRIKNSVEIELTLVKAIHELRERVNFSPEAKAMREEARNALRSRSGVRPNFLRRRSLSGDRTFPKIALSSSDDLSPPSPRNLRKATSSGSLVERIGRFTSTSPERSRSISSQAGIDNETQGEDLEEGLIMTTTPQIPQVAMQA